MSSPQAVSTLQSQAILHGDPCKGKGLIWTDCCIITLLLEGLQCQTESCGNEDHVYQLYLRAKMWLGEAECHKNKCIFPTLGHHCKSVLLLRKSKVIPRLSVASKSSLDAWGCFSSGLDPPDPDSCLFDCCRSWASPNVHPFTSETQPWPREYPLWFKCSVRIWELRTRGRG